MDIANHPDVIRVLEWAEATARRTNDPELYLDRLPPELQSALTVCEARGWVQLFGLGAKFVLLTDPGAGILAEHRLAPTTPPVGNSEHPAEAPKQGRPKKGRPKKGPSVNQCMAEMFQADTSRVEWPARRWAEVLTDRLKRSITPAAVKQTKTWKLVMTTRAMLKAERAER